MAKKRKVQSRTKLITSHSDFDILSIKNIPANQHFLYLEGVKADKVTVLNCLDGIDIEQCHSIIANISPELANQSMANHENRPEWKNGATGEARKFPLSSTEGDFIITLVLDEAQVDIKCKTLNIISTDKIMFNIDKIGDNANHTLTISSAFINSSGGEPYYIGLE